MSGFGYNILGFGANASGAAGDPVDDQFNRVSFLSHFDGSNNGVNNAFDDGSASNHTVTANGNITQGSFGPFARPDGEWGVSFDGDSDYLQVAASSDFDFGTGDFTVELFFFHKKHGANYDYLATFGNAVEATTSFGIYLDGAGSEINLWNNGAITSSTSYNLNQWYHLAVARASGTVKVYLDGSEIKSASLSSDISSPGGMNVANWRLAGDSQYFNGVISNLRVVKGTAVYTGNFTAPTSKLTAITNTKLLTCQSNRFVDNSASAHTVTAGGTAAVTAFGAIQTSAVYDAAVNGASAYLALGDSDYLQMPAQTIPTGSFTLEGWYYLIGTGQGQTVISQGSSGSSTRTFYGLEGNRSTFQMGGTVQRGITTPRNSWNYFACVYNSSYPFIQLWDNGVSQGATSYTGGNAENVAMQIGTLGSNWGTGYGFTGYVADIRVSSGIKYTANNITVPTSPLAVQDSNTKLLLNMKDGQAIDSAAQNNLTLVNDAKTSTTRAKFGNTSLYLDGSDYAIIENSQSRAFGTGDFTVEFFIWLNGSPDQFDYIFDMRSSSDLTYTWALSFNYMGSATNDELQWASNNTSPNAILRAVYPSLNQWVHIAVCRSGTTTRMFYDGTQVAINTSDSADYRDTGYQGYIGCRHSIGNYIDAYMDEIRFSKTARYTSNFTAPTKAFDDKGQ